MEIQEKKNIYVGVQTTQTRDIRDFMMEINSYKNIMVFAEVGDDKVCENSLELLGEANRLKAMRNNDSWVIAAMVGNDVKKYAPTLFGYGADKVVAFDSPQLENYRSDLYGEALAGIINAYHPEIVLIGATALGSELAPTVAAKLRTGLLHTVPPSRYLKTDSLHRLFRLLAARFLVTFTSRIIVRRLHQ